MANSSFYIGTYSDANAREDERSQGIYRASLNVNNGALEDLQPAAWASNGCFLAISANRRFLYAIGDTFEPDVQLKGAVAAFAVDEQSGNLHFLNQQPTPNGISCHVNVDATNRLLVSVSYRRGSFASYLLAPDGTIDPFREHVQHHGQGTNPTRQEGPHAHQAIFSPDNRFLLVNDLGIDKIGCYAIDPTLGQLVPESVRWTKVHDGAGPRHLAFHPNGRYVYLINELDSTITVFAYGTASGSLQELQVISTLPEGYTGEKWCADIHVHPSGRFLYGSNRGHNSIVIYAIDEASGRVRTLGYQASLGKTPRNFAIDPTGKFLLVANQDGNSIVSFAINPEQGLLSTTGHSLTLSKPVCIKF
ncbi:MAG: lactonase family protein [Caldilineaceae bacterium]